MPPHRCSWRSDRAVCHGTERAASERRAETQSPSRRPRQHPNFCPDFCRISRVSSLPALGGCRLSHNPSRASSPSPLTVTTYPRLTTLSLTTTLPVRSRLRDRSAPATASWPGLPSRPARVRWSVARPGRSREGASQTAGTRSRRTRLQYFSGTAPFAFLPLVHYRK